jgi:arylformamidase
MIYLSHYLNDKTPRYAGNTADLVIEPASCICNGDSANSVKISFKNHISTHIDFPKHFDDQGKVLNDYSPSDFFFKNPQLLDLPVAPAHLISVDDLDGKIKLDTDILIIKTGFEKERENESYWNNNPGVNLEVGLWLRQKYPNIRAIGFDFISLSSFKHRMVGRQAHKEFLSQEFDGGPIWIIEDMKLSELTKQPNEIMVIPFLIDQADGGPVTVIAKL